ncbi:hypothetical protein EVAR_90753_1 [Eumeta japonica]|uniref:Uncharacterized protein n=1 Tax=Eumeta variegata TaxID=151549 RepID=A0A4C1ZBN7_EUMVA|nr:hypothetical protein EVAR_90753_1 [Eumeta japonica]
MWWVLRTRQECAHVYLKRRLAQHCDHATIHSRSSLAPAMRRDKPLQQKFKTKRSLSNAWVCHTPPQPLGLTCSMQPTADPRICLSTTNLYPND